MGALSFLGCSMKKLILVALFLLGALFLTVGYAEQGCADGFVPNPVPSGTPGQNQCVPMPGQNRGGNSPSAPEVRWAKRWGAFALDSKGGQLGVASGEASKRKAQNAAVDHCRQKGGSNCQVGLAFYNQCGAVAWGEGGGGIVSFGSAATRDDAEAEATKRCSHKTSGSCEIIKYECSFAERVQ